MSKEPVVAYEIVGVNQVKLIVGGFKMTCTLDEANKYLLENKQPLISNRAYHYSTTLNKYIPIDGMSLPHIKNHLLKEDLFSEWQLNNITNNRNNCRAYIKRIIEIVETK